MPERVRAELEQSFDVAIHDEELPPARAELLGRVAGCNGLVTMLTDRVDAELLDAAGPQLRVVANYAVGLDNVDLDECDRRGIAVSNTPDVLTDATAEMTIALMLALTRRVVEGDRFVRAGEPWLWAPTFMLGEGLAGKTLGIVGFGRIGWAVAGSRTGTRHGGRAHARDAARRAARGGGRRLAPRAADRRDAAPDRRARARADEADRLPRQHEPRARSSTRRRSPVRWRPAGSPARRSTSTSESRR